jgi:toxin ParE1/3/4
LTEILARSVDQFGPTAADRYRDLVQAALRDLRDNPERAGSRQIEGGRWLYHLRSSRGRLFGSGVRAPRHFLLYRHDDVRVELLRVLHDAMDLPARLTDDA